MKSTIDLEKHLATRHRMKYSSVLNHLLHLQTESKMLIYIFAEHYPNPYKPQFDTEFAFLVRQGFAIRIYVGGKFDTTLHPRVRKYSLQNKTYTLPTTLRTFYKYIPTLIARFFISPIKCILRAQATYNKRHTLKKNFIRIAKALLLPIQSPDLCYIHNIATAEGVDFLNRIYPECRMAMYFHGGEVGGVKRVNQEADLFNQMHVVFSNTNFSKNQAISRGCPPDRAIALPVGFDLSDYPVSTTKIYRSNGYLNLISIGRLSDEKGLVFALDALTELVATGFNKITYTIVGRGLQDDYLKKYVNEKELNDFVTFAGEQDKTGVVEYLKSADVLILPSLITDTWAETQAAVVQEAMLMRVLVIGTKAGGVPESTASNLHQFSVPVGDASAIVDRVRKILHLTPKEMFRIGDKARNFAINRFDIESIGPRMISYAMGNKVVEK